MDDQLERSTQVGILLFEEVDLLDVGGPYEVFLTTSRLAQRRGDPPPFEVFTMGLSRTPVTAYGGLRLTPDRLVDNTEKLIATTTKKAKNLFESFIFMGTQIDHHSGHYF